MIKGYRSGKSTLLNIILGYTLPIQKILVNDIDVKDLPPSNYINVGFISQNILLNDTIRSNIYFEKSKKICFIILKLFFDNIFSNFEISNKKKGQYEINYRCIKRINIGRVIFYNPEVLLVDEAMSNLI